MKRLLLPLLAISVLPACISLPEGGQQVSVTVQKLSAPPPELHWFRNSAERRAAYEQAYREATAAVKRAAANESPGSWAVILDVDETTLDNSEFQARLAVSGQGYSDAAWSAWVSDQRAVALPGVKRFFDTVKDELRGQVVLVTNRTQAACSATESNLRAQGLRYDRILCAVEGPEGKPVSDKNPRFEQVQAGDPSQNLRPLKVLAYVGDNIQDFPGLTQQQPGDFSKFGVEFFVLPNPMYGSWVGNPYR